ncbi:MAG TPA: zinc ribbon domain-containing protein, partial [Methylomirabilota bacterium]|nr:zinc ribbon domain-containing protein [Methylomirabilota bacterium]
MTGDTVECFNCGHENPSWAQVCRSCGYALQQVAPTTGGPAGLFPTDQASLTAIGGAMAAIVGAIVLGLILSGLIPPAPNIAAETPSPTPTPSASASASEIPSVVESASSSAVASPSLPGTIIFGTGWNKDTLQITGPTTDFTAASSGFAHAISLADPIGVDRLQEEVVRLAADGTETVVQSQSDGTVFVDATRTTDGFKSTASMSALLAAWGKGTMVMR